MSDCQHTQTQNYPDPDVHTCVDCGAVVMLVEKRECQGCLFFKDMGPYNGPPICRKHLMGVSRTMRVTYKVGDGTCWTAKEE